MRKYPLELLIDVIWKDCFSSNKEREYITTDDVIIEVGNYETLQKIVPNIISSMAVETSTFPTILIIKEQMVSQEMLKFIIFHEMGHIHNKDIQTDDIILSREQERLADEYAIEKGGFDRKEVFMIIKEIFKPYLNLIEKEAPRHLEYTKKEIEIRINNISHKS